MDTSKFRVIAYDLDDTLIDTSGLLIPAACQNIYLNLKAAGFENSFKEFDTDRRLNVSHLSHKDYFKQLSEKLYPSDLERSKNLTQNLTNLFYEPDVPSKMPFIDGVEKNLNALQKKYKLYVVTAGVVSAQYKKLNSLGIEKWIPKENWYIVSKETFSSKRDAFKNILKKEQIEPKQLLAIGNRLSQEIKMAKEIGASTCFFKFGEHSSEKPMNDYEKPDFIISDHKDFILTCQL